VINIAVAAQRPEQARAEVHGDVLTSVRVRPSAYRNPNSSYSRAGR